MSGVTRRIIGLGLPPLIFCAFDAAITLVGQSADYWAGDYSAVRETSPTFNHLLQIHPAVFGLGIATWTALFVGLVLLLPDTAALIVSIAVTFGHTVGAATWLFYRFQYGYQMCNALFLASAVVLGLGIRWGWQASPESGDRLAERRPVLRWVLVAGLFGLGLYLFVWPRSA